MSLSALVFGCDKHDDDYKNNIPEWKEPVSEEVEKPEEPDEVRYSLERLNEYYGDLHGDEDVFRRVGGQFIDCYMTVDNVSISGVLFESDECRIKFRYGGSRILNSFCAEGPEGLERYLKLAKEYGDVYGQYDAVRTSSTLSWIEVTRNNIKYHVYDLKSNYAPDHDAGNSLDDVISYGYSEREYRRPLDFGPWTETRMVAKKELLEEYNPKELILLSRDGNELIIPYPEEAGTYSFRIVAQSGDEILCDQTIEDIKLPARKK